MGEKEKDKKDRSKRTERSSSGRDRDRDSDRASRSGGSKPEMSRTTSLRSMTSSGDNLRGRDGGGRDRRSDSDNHHRSSSSRALTRNQSARSLRPTSSTIQKEGSGHMEQSSSIKGKSGDKKSDVDTNATGGRRTLERQSSNNEDSMAMLLGLVGKKGPRKRSGSSSSSSSSASSSGDSTKGPPITGEKPKAKNTKLNPKLFPGHNPGGEANKLKEGSNTVQQKVLEKTEFNIEDGSLDLSDRKKSISNTRDDSSDYTDGSSFPPAGEKAAKKKVSDRNEDPGLTLNLSKLTFPSVNAFSKKNRPTEPNAFISRPDLRTVDQSVNLRDLEAGKKKPGLGDVYLGESGSTAFSSSAFSSGGGSSRTSFVRNKKNPYLKVSAWEQFSYYVKDFCRSLSDCVCNRYCALLLLVTAVAGALVAVLMTQKITIKSSKLLVPQVDAGLFHTVISTIQHEGVTYLAPVFTEEEAVQRIGTFQNILSAHGMNSSNSFAQEALRWIAQFDPARLDIEANEEAILQRYALAVLFFSAHPGTMANRTTDEALTSGIHDSVDTDLDDNSVAAAGAHQENQDQRRIDSYGANWMMGDICSWQGILCEESRTEVVHLNMSSSMLQGTLPVELTLLKGLTKIDMSHNYLEGPLPDLYVERLTKLTYLMLQDNLLSGVLPANIGTWTSLTYVNLAENKIGGCLPVDLDQLSKLMSLFLHGNLMSGRIPSFKGMKDLGKWALSWNV
jgi:Leucine rich repeat